MKIKSKWFLTLINVNAMYSLSYLLLYLLIFVFGWGVDGNSWNYSLLNVDALRAVPYLQGPAHFSSGLINFITKRITWMISLLSCLFLVVLILLPYFWTKGKVSANSNSIKLVKEAPKISLILPTNFAFHHW